MKSSESNPPVKTTPRQAEAGPEEEAFPEELMRLARPPKGITAEVKDGVLTIRARWWSWWSSARSWSWVQEVPGRLMLFVFAGPLFVISLYYFWDILSFKASDAPSQGGAELLIWIFSLTVLWVAMMGLSRNSSTIVVDRDTVSVSHRRSATQPTPFDGPFQTASIAQVYVERGQTLCVGLQDHSGKRAPLLDGLRSYEQAKFIEHRLEAFLGIANRRVEGEVED